MLYRELLTTELDKQRIDFQRFSATQSSDLTAYLEKLEKLCRMSSGEIWARLQNVEAPGALPAAELDARKSFSFHFAEKWENHEQARLWASRILKNRTTFAADGSQLYVEKEVSLPVAAIQVGWFENPHDENQSYEKNARFFVLSPDKLLSKDEPVVPETKVGQLRFEAEIEKVIEFLRKKSGWQTRGERMPLAFYDGTLLLSTPHPDTGLQASFTNKLVELARVSIETKVPLVGYVDRSYARDLLTMLENFEPMTDKHERTLYDATILHAETANFAQVLKFWGDRTCFCYSKRRGLSQFIDAETGKSIVGFSYLQTTSEGSPARLDIPAWIYEEGLLEEVLDVARAECVIGLGYPYALETADQTALITMRDREVFLAALQDFAGREKLNFSVSRKNASKGRRR
ncbi:MAG TPA: DNA double-strand break repair nuclease NurA [Pyrinomonadaceae bacterium]|nr:DNA double-strand break repair nuclease NurA [Pyrinomonadaceae bacterium]